MAKSYELAFLIKEGDISKAVVERIREYLKKAKATITGEQEMGNRQLAYIIRRNREDFHRAFYFFVKADMAPTQVAEFEHLIKYDEDVIRHMVLVLN